MSWHKKLRRRVRKHAKRAWSSAKGLYRRTRQRFSRKSHAPSCIATFKLKTKRGPRCVCASVGAGGRFSTIFKPASACKRGTKTMTWKQAEARYAR